MPEMAGYHLMLARELTAGNIQTEWILKEDAHPVIVVLVTVPIPPNAPKISLIVISALATLEAAVKRKV
jgi:hypothetical protein